LDHDSDFRLSSSGVKLIVLRFLDKFTAVGDRGSE